MRPNEHVDLFREKRRDQKEHAFMGFIERKLTFPSAMGHVTLDERKLGSTLLQ